ncbi:MAG: protein kinase domain-containing protein [Thermoleophilaceae bacterium]
MTTPTEVAGRYRIDSRLGAGGMSTVFQATDTVLERPVAIKLLAEHLAEDDAFVARFRREALAAARLQHPNVVQVFDSGHDLESGRHYIVMELVDGPSCADLLRDYGTLDVDSAVYAIRDACHGLDYAHRSGLVHRDVKPGNLLVSNETGATKLADFGIAKAAEQSRITQVGSVLGTAAYLSPEQARGEEAGPLSDVYSLGVCAYQFLTGRLPHEYSSLTELALKQQNDAVEPVSAVRPDVPEALDRAILVCLSREQEARYPSALDMAEAFDAGLYNEATDATVRLEDTTQGLDEHPDVDATQALSTTGATQALTRRTATGANAPASAPRRAAEPSAPARTSTPAERRRKRVRLIALALIVLLIGVGVALATTLGGSDPGPAVPAFEETEIDRQVQGLRDLIEENVERPGQ